MYVRADRLRDPVRDRRREARSCRAIDVVLRDPYVVGRRAPVERDRPESAVGGQVRRCARRRRVGHGDARVHVAADLRRGERLVVDADLVDQAVERLPPDAVAADPELAVRGRDRTGRERRRDLGAVDVQRQHGSVVGDRQVRPGVHRHLGVALNLGVARRLDSAGRCVVVRVRVHRVSSTRSSVPSRARCSSRCRWSA